MGSIVETAVNMLKQRKEESSAEKCRQAEATRLFSEKVCERMHLAPAVLVIGRPALHLPCHLLP